MVRALPATHARETPPPSNTHAQSGPSHARHAHMGGPPAAPGPGCHGGAEPCRSQAPVCAGWCSSGALHHAGMVAQAWPPRDLAGGPWEGGIRCNPNAPPCRRRSRARRTLRGPPPTPALINQAPGQHTVFIDEDHGFLFDGGCRPADDSCHPPAHRDIGRPGPEHERHRLLHGALPLCLQASLTAA